MYIRDKIRDLVLNNQPRLSLGPNKVRLLGYGTHRVVFEVLSGPMCGKVVKFVRGENMNVINQAEVATWRMANATQRQQYFCPIDDYDKESYMWILMDKADMSVSDEKIRSFVRSVKAEFPQYTPDLSGSNLGLHRGEIKMVDYAWI